MASDIHGSQLRRDFSINSGNLSEKSVLREIFDHITLVRDSMITSAIAAFIVLFVHKAINIRSMLAVVGIGLGYGLAFAVNDYFDAPFDKLSEDKSKSNYFVNNSVTRITKTFLVGVLLSLFAIFSVFGINGIVLLIFSIFMLLAYSAEPIRFKTKPGFDVLIHGIFVEVYPFALPVLLLQLRFLPIDYIVMGILFLNSMINQIEQQKRDYELDILTHQTFVTTVGKDRSSIVIKILNLGIFIILGIGFINEVIPSILIPQVIIALPLTLHRFIVNSEENRSQKLYNYTLYSTIIYWVGVLLWFVFH